MGKEGAGINRSALLKTELRLDEDAVGLASGRAIHSHHSRSIALC